LIRSEKLAETLLSQIRRGQADGMVPEATWISAERFADSLSSYMHNALASGRAEQTTFKPPLPELMTVASDQKLSDGALSWMINSEGTVGVLLVCLTQDQNAAQAKKQESSLSRLRTLAQEAESSARTDSADLKVSLTGMPALEHDELRSTSIDIRNAGLLAALLVGTVLFVVFRGMRHPMLALMTLLVSLCWTFGAATAVVGSVNIVSICFAIFLIGLSIDFSVSFIHRYLALRQELYELPAALREAAETTGGGILISAATAALAFSTALLTGFPGVAELGLIAAMGAVLCAASVFWFLPALIAISDHDVDVEQLPEPIPAAKLAGWLTAWPIPAAAGAVVLVLLFSWQAFRWSDGRLQSRVSYNPNLLELQDQQAESVLAERALDAANTETVLHAVSIAGSWEQAMQLSSRFLKLSSVGRVSDAASKLPEQPSGGTMQLLQSLQQQAASLPTASPSLREGSYLDTGRQSDALYAALKKSDHPRAKAAAASLDQFLNDLSKTPARESAAILTAWNTMTVRWLLGEYQEIAAADRFDPVDLRDLPRELKSRFLKIDADGKQQWALRIYPKDNVWSGPELDRFVRELRTVDPSVTGAPVQVY
ncbi:MAG: MMPL family transporter, partial [Planctomycetaceae bacterium]